MDMDADEMLVDLWLALMLWRAADVLPEPPAAPDYTAITRDLS